MSGAAAMMDYNLGALKLLTVQLKNARNVPPQSRMLYGGLLFQRVWLQGVLISVDYDNKVLLDDGTGVVELTIIGDFRQRQWNAGMYVMVVGGCALREDAIPLIKVHKIVDLSFYPDREAMWYLEVAEVYKLFYQPLVEEFV